MKNTILFGLLVLILLVLLFGTTDAHSPIVVDHNSVDLFEQIPQEYLDTAQGMSMFFSDRSVGSNLNDGLSCLASNYDTALNSCRVWQHVNPTYTIAPEVWIGSYPRRLWAYRDGDSAIKAANWWYWTPAKVWGYFPSYLEAPGMSGKVDSTLQPILDTGGDSQRVAWTSSLARGSDMQTAQVNAEIREWAAIHGLPLLDAADILSHRPDGTPCYDNRDGVPYGNVTKAENYPDDGIDAPAICQEYTTEVEGGHLGSVAIGKIRLAKAVWVMMAQIAGWTPSAITPPPTITVSPTETVPPITETPIPTETPSPTSCAAIMKQGVVVQLTGNLAAYAQVEAQDRVVGTLISGQVVAMDDMGNTLLIAHTNCTTRLGGVCTLQVKNIPPQATNIAWTINCIGE